MQSAPEVKYRSILDFDTPIEWVNTEGMDCNEEFVGENYGRINKPEAELSIGQLKEYITKIGRERFLEERIERCFFQALSFPDYHQYGGWLSGAGA